jgi:hypothetical protein
MLYLTGKLELHQSNQFKYSFPSNENNSVMYNAELLYASGSNPFKKLTETQRSMPSDDFSTKVIGNESLHEISNDNGVTELYSATSENLALKTSTLPHSSIHKYTWTSPEGNTQPD